VAARIFITETGQRRASRTGSRAGAPTLWSVRVPFRANMGKVAVWSGANRARAAPTTTGRRDSLTDGLPGGLRAAVHNACGRPNRRSDPGHRRESLQRADFVRRGAYCDIHLIGLSGVGELGGDGVVNWVERTPPWSRRYVLQKLRPGRPVGGPPVPCSRPSSRIAQVCKVPTALEPAAAVLVVRGHVGVVVARRPGEVAGGDERHRPVRQLSHQVTQVVDGPDVPTGEVREDGPECGQVRTDVRDQR
jgi:hypothetical protein